MLAWMVCGDEVEKNLSNQMGISLWHLCSENLNSNWHLFGGVKACQYDLELMYR